MKHRWILAATLAAQGMAPMLPVWAQTVYESKDKAGPVFSDRPAAGATAVQLPPPNVADGAPAATAKPPPTASAAAAPAYKRFVITRPAAQDTVHSNTGAFDIAAAVSPPLRTGDRVRVLLDGSLLNGVYRNTSPRIGPADWQWAAASANSEHTLQLVVVDAAGQPLIETPPVSFYVRRATVGAARR